MNTSSSSLYTRLIKNIKKRYYLYLMMLLPMVYLLIFKYYPMYGAQIAFKKFIAAKGIEGSPWIGLQNFQKFISSYIFWRLLKNTLVISLYQLIAGFPIPIILALALNSTKKDRFKKTVQMTTYLPHFISTVVMVSIVMQVLSPKTGLVGNIARTFGFTAVDVLGKPEWFSSVFVWSSVWQSAGWGTIVYLASLASIDQSLHESAVVDGATRFQRIINIDIPGIMPTMVTLFILNAGKIMNVGFEKIFLLQNPLNITTSEIIATYTYKVGLASSAADFSYASAIGLFNSIINLILIVIVNNISKKLSESSLW